MRYSLVEKKEIESIRIRDCLSPLELDHYRALAPYKKANWLAGRIAVKRALEKLHLFPLKGLSEITIQNSANGQPYIVGHEHLYCSLGHSHSCGAGVVSSVPVGIDIEKNRPHRREVLQYIADGEEIGLMEEYFRLRSGDLVTVMWTVKEAVMKGLGIGLAINPKRLKIREPQGGTIPVEVLENSIVGPSLWESVTYRSIPGFQISVAYPSQ